MSHEKPGAEQADSRCPVFLDGDPETVKAFYANWANSYDEDVATNHRGTQEIVDVLNAYLNNTPNDSSKDRAQLKVADVGCGTYPRRRSSAQRGIL